jgi:F0F1-type ATP synthase membrane subunit c/vacuolar-type H+-ATPase subunit K
MTFLAGFIIGFCACGVAIAIGTVWVALRMVKG